MNARKGRALAAPLLPTPRGTASTWALAATPFHVRVAERDGVRVVEVEGEIDILTAPPLAVALGDDHGCAEALVLDLACSLRRTSQQRSGSWPIAMTDACRAIAPA